MNRISILLVLVGSLLTFPANAAAQPAPADKGLAGDGPEVVQVDAQESGGEKEANSGEAQTAKTLEQQIADLETEIKALRTTLAKMTDAQKDLETLQSKVNILEGENTALAARVKTLESSKDLLDKRVASLEGDNATTQETLAKIPSHGHAQEQTAAKPAFTYAAVRFHNHENHTLRMNVNGVWHTLEPGQNDVWVPHGPVHIYRYTDAEPKVFMDWKPYKTGVIMEFDVGTPAEK